MPREPEIAGEGLGLGEVVEGEHPAALGILETKEPAPRVVEVVPRLDRRPHRVEGQSPVRREVEGLGLDPPEGGRPARLGPVAVRPLSGDVLVAAPAVGEEGEQVALGPARHEERSFHPHHLGRPAFKGIDGGIFSVDVVAHLRRRHRLAHGQRRHGHRVASKVNHLAWASPQDCRRPGPRCAERGPRSPAGVHSGGARRFDRPASISGVSAVRACAPGPAGFPEPRETVPILVRRVRTARASDRRGPWCARRGARASSPRGRGGPRDFPTGWKPALPGRRSQGDTPREALAGDASQRAWQMEGSWSRRAPMPAPMPVR